MITDQNLNILFIKKHSFPNGLAMAKRHRIIIEYLNKKEISSGALQTRSGTDMFKNPIEGKYGHCKYLNANYYWEKGFIGKFIYLYKILMFIYNFRNKNKLNIAIFTGTIYLDDLPLYLFFKILGYRIIHDIVENFSVSGHNSSQILHLSNWLSQKLYKKSLCIFAISTKLEEHVKSLAKDVPICLMPNSTYIQNNNTKNKISTPIKIMYAGTFAEKDGVQYLIKGFEIFNMEIINKAELHLVGKGQKSDMIKILELVKHNYNIKYHGFLSDSDLMKLMNECDILTMTRNNSDFANYGFPFKLSEYLSTGNIVIASNVGDVDKYLTHRKNALLIKPEDPNDIFESLLFVYNNCEEALKIGRNGKKVVLKEFNPDINGEKFISFIKLNLNK